MLNDHQKLHISRNCLCESESATSLTATKSFDFSFDDTSFSLNNCSNSFDNLLSPEKVNE